MHLFLWMLFGSIAGFGAEILSAKSIIKDRKGYYALSDGSVWRVIGFDPRWRTPSEWWNNVELVSKRYECLPNQWEVGAVVEIYPKYDYLTADENNASNKEALQQCSHMLVNLASGQVLFAAPLTTGAFFQQFYQDVYGIGFDKGYSEGYQQGKRVARNPVP